MSFVKLLEHTPNPEKLVAAAAKLCYSGQDADQLYENLDEEKVAAFIKKLSESGHLSPFEHITFSFAVSDISRACSHQLVRHRTGIAFSQRSQRYVRGAANFIIPPKMIWNKNEYIESGYMDAVTNLIDAYEEMLEVTDIPAEDARYLLPNCVETAMLVTINARELLHIASLRLCKRAQWEIREVVAKMVQLAREVCPNIFANVGPSCLTEGKCKEHSSCGCPYTGIDEMLQEQIDQDRIAKREWEAMQEEDKEDDF